MNPDYSNQKTVRFFAFQIPLKERFKMQMALVESEKDNVTHPETIWHDFIEERVQTQVPELENLKLYSLSLQISTGKTDKEEFRTIQENDILRRICGYKIRISCDNKLDGRSNTYRYYEDSKNFRKTFRYPNTFIFNISILKEEVALIFKDAPCKIIQSTWEQTLYFVISLIETGNIEELKDFIAYTQKTISTATEMKQVDRQKLLEMMHKYCEKKQVFTTHDFNVLFPIICMFGLIPEKESFFIKMAPVQFIKLIHACEANAERILAIETHLLDAFQKGLCLLYLLEESKTSSLHYGVNLLTKLGAGKDFTNLLIQNLMMRISLLEWRMRYSNIKEIFKFAGPGLPLYGFCSILLPLSHSLADLGKISKEFIIAQCNEATSSNPSPTMMEKALKDAKDKVARLFVSYLEKNPNWKSELNLEMLAGFLREVSEEKDYLESIFSENQEFCKGLCSFLVRTKYYDESSLEWLCKILVGYFNPSLLPEIYIPSFILSIIDGRGQRPQDFNYYVKFFCLFMTHTSLTSTVFDEALGHWIRNIDNKKDLLLWLDKLYELFHMNFDTTVKKKKKLVEALIACIDLNNLEESVESVVKNVKLQEAHDCFLQNVTKEIDNRYLNSLLTKNIENPLLIFQRLSKTYPNNNLIMRLIEHCLLKLPILDREAVLTSLFKKQDMLSLLALILNEDVFRDSKIYRQVIEICCGVVDDLQTCNLEFKWVADVPEEKLEITYQLLRPIAAIVSERNSVPKTIDIKLLIKDYKDNWRKKLKKIEDIEDFINTYCKEAGDAPKLLETLETVKKNSYEKRLNDLISPAELNIFEPYIAKLCRYYNSEAFKVFRINNPEKGRPLKCIDEARRADKQLETFRSQVESLVDDNAIVSQLSALFSSVKDIAIEIAILKPLWEDNPGIPSRLYELLKFINYLETIKNICKGISLCIEKFNLICDRQSAIKDGSNLSLEQSVGVFYNTNKVLGLLLQFQENEPLCQILSHFGDAQKLLIFTIARTDKLEIDYMVQAVNAYDSVDHVTTQTILDFYNFWYFINDLSLAINPPNGTRGKTIFDFFDSIRKLIEKDFYTDILINIETCKTNFYGIQSLYLELAHKEEAKRQQIFRILERAALKKIIQKKKKFDIELECVTERAGQKTNRTLNFADLLELRDRARLIVYTEQKKIANHEAEQNNEEAELEKINLFCSRVDVVEQLLKVLNQSVIYGSPEFSVGTNETMINANFNIEPDGEDQLSKFRDHSVQQFEALKSSIAQACHDYYELTYLKGRDFWEVERALRSQKRHASIQGLNILSFIGKEYQRYPLNINETIENRLRTIGLALASLPNDLPQSLPKRRSIKEHTSFTIIEVNEKAIIRGLMTLYCVFETTIPLARQLLVCHSSTSDHELTAFALRCFWSPEETLFCLIQPERLSFALQGHFASVIKNCKEKYPLKKFHLGFVTTNKQINLIAALRNKNATKIFRNDELIKEPELIQILQEKTTNCTIVTSKFTGLGKSSFIKNYARDNGLELFKVPISGSIKPSKIGIKLVNQTLLKKSVLWLSIGSIDEQDRALLNEILFSLIVLRCFHDSKNIAVLHKDVTIFIEMDSSYFENSIHEIEILGYLRVKDFEKMDWAIFDYLSPKTQFVCHYIKMIEDKSLGMTDITEDDTNSQILPNDICQRILQNLLMKMQDIDKLSYTQLNIFIDILYSLFKGFSQSGFFLFYVLSKQGEFDQPEERPNNESVLKKVGNFVNKVGTDISLAVNRIEFMKDSQIAEMRISLAKALIDTASKFTSEAVQNIQRDAITDQEGVALIQRANQLVQGAVVSWKEFKPFIVVFTSDNSPIFIYKNPSDIPAPVHETITHHIKALSGGSKTLLAKLTQDFLIDYQQCKDTELFKRLVRLTRSEKDQEKTICFRCFCRYDNRPPASPEKSQDSKILSTPELPCPECEKGKNNDVNQYALTPDNFIKMVLIYIKAKQRIPVIIMGETGCGKTSLIRYLCTKILDDEFQSFSIHAGIDHSAILEKMKELILKADEIKGENKRLWLFFDEFNTTSSIGLIKEIICERTMLGEELPSNMVFLGACNPWRLRPDSLCFNENVGLTKKINQANHKSNLLYTVHPLPETMVDYIWDYGSLDQETEKRYIEAMFSDLEVGGNPNLKHIMVDIVSASHQRLRNMEDTSSVSLRDCTRYKTLFKWFCESIIKRNALDGKQIDAKIPYQQAAILAMVSCYYLRMSEQEKRQNFLKDLEPYTKHIMTTKEIENLIEDQEKDFLRRMQPLPNGIALNKALRENVFALIVCILTKTPIFICGKPGCSKSLAIQLVFTHLRGANSKDEYFRTLPQLIPVPYQGSEYCTSDSILSLFDKATKYFKVTATNTILPVIVFDEIGLAENSENNPLKVLHSKLEIEDIEVGFIGVSNWRLDASKMNRALYLARVDPDYNDLVATAHEISQSILRNTDVILPMNIIKAVTIIYMNLMEFKEESRRRRKENTFGLRDYYATIKGISEDLVNAQKDASKEDCQFFIVRKNLKMNFSGLNNEYEFLWKLFCQNMARLEKENQIREVSVQDLIWNNLTRKEGRYLMLITESDCVSEYIEQLMKQNIQRGPGSASNEKNFEAIRTLAGSQLVDDLKNESYGYRLLSDIILYMEKAYALIFRKMDRLYSSLYDLFNQNFSDQGGSSRKYCKIALGVLYNANCYVHPNFHCIIFINDAEMRKADPPFLSRFEKYRLVAEDFLSPNERIIHNKLIMWINSIVASNEGDATKPEFIFMNYNPEYPFSLIIRTKNELNATGENNSDEIVLEMCKEKLINIASFDFAILVSRNIHDRDERQNLLNMYFQAKSLSFKSFLEKLEAQQDKNTQSVVYTYSQISEDIKCFDKSHFKELKLGNFKSEAELQEEVKRWLNSESTILIVRVDLITEGQHLLYLKHLLVNTTSTSKRRGLHMVIMVHLQRFNVGDKNISIDTVFQDWEPIMFDNLNDDYVIPNRYFEITKFRELVALDLLPKIGDVIEGLFDKCLSKMRYAVKSEDQEEVNTRRKKILEDLKQDTSGFLGIIGRCVEKMIHNEQVNEKFEDWRKYINNNLIKAKATSSLDAIKTALSEYYESFLMKIIHVLERDHLLDAYLEAVRSSNNPMRRIWEECFQGMDLSVFDEQVKEIDFVFGLHFPFSYDEQPRVKQIQEEAEGLKKQHTDIELIYRMSLDKLTESSFFGSTFSEYILTDKVLFEEYFKDQILLYLRANKLKLKEETALKVLELMFFNTDRAFKYFLAESKSLNLIFGTVAAVASLQEGQDVLERCLGVVYNFDEVGFDSISLDNVSSRVLIYKNTKYYNVGPNKLKELINRTATFESLTPSKNKEPFLDFFFTSIIAEISSCKYLVNCKSVQEIKSSFKLIEDKMSRTKCIPWNIGVFKPWIDVIQFIESCDKYPDNRFPELVKSLTRFEERYKNDGLFSQSESIEHIVEYLKSPALPENLEEIEKHNNLQKLQKLHSQLYKNLVSYHDGFLEKALQVIDEYHDLWKSSAKIIQWIDGFTKFSATISSTEGRIDNSKELKLKILAGKIKDRTSRIHKILVNKGFMMLENEWYAHHQRKPEKIGKFLKDKFAVFGDNLDYFLKLSKKREITLAFLGVIIWLKVYLYLYSLALESNVLEIPDIDGELAKDSLELATLKLYVLKDIKLRNKKSLGQLRDQYRTTTTKWIKSLLKEEVSSNKAANVNLPACFDKRAEESKLLDEICDEGKDDRMQDFLKLCKASKESYSQALRIYSWFIKYYLRHLNENFTPEIRFIKLIEQHKEPLTKYLGDMGYNFIHRLVTNFVESSFFRLFQNVKAEEVYQKLAALGVLASFLAQQFLDTSFASIIFENKRFQKDLAAHMTTRLLYGQIESNSAVNHVKDVKKNIEKRLKQNQMCQYIYKCSMQCKYYFLPDEDGHFVSTKNCPLCAKETNFELVNVRNSSTRHMKLPVADGLKEIDSYIKECEEVIKKGYIYNAPEQSNKNDTKPHLTPITFRTMHFFLHTILFGLVEADFISEKELDTIVGPENPRKGREYFKKHFTNDYKMLSEITRPRECYIWVYKVIADLHKIVGAKSTLNSTKRLKDFEEYFERQIDIGLSSFTSTPVGSDPHIDSNSVDYKGQDNILTYLDELEDNTEKYPNLEFFNYMEFPDFKNFETQFLFMTSNSQGFPLLSFVLKNIRMLANVSSLAPIVEFTNKLRGKYNYKISREDANSSKMKNLINQDNQDSQKPTLQKEYEDVMKCWNKVKLEPVEVESHAREFQPIDLDSSLSMFLPDMQKPNSNGILLIGIMRTLADMQNDLVYLTKVPTGSTKSIKEIIEEEKSSMELVQNVQKEDLIDISLERVLDWIVKNGYIHNCDKNGTGKRMGIIYDFEEIESMIFQEVNKKKLFNNEKFIQICYAFEPHPEKNSIITDVRRKNHQRPIPPQKRNELFEFFKNGLSGSSKKRDLVNSLGSLDYIFTYLCNVKVQKDQTIGDFCQKWISNSQYISEVIKKDQIAKIPLDQILDLYESIEEQVFDEAFRGGNQIRFEGDLDSREISDITGLFDNATIRSTWANLCTQLKDPYTLTKVIKRIILRGLVSHSSQDNTLQSCFLRPDLWSQDIDMSYLNKVKLDESIKLKHSYIILEHLEHKIMAEHSYNDMNISNDDEGEPPGDSYHRALEREESDSGLEASQIGKRPSEND